MKERNYFRVRIDNAQTNILIHSRFTTNLQVQKAKWLDQQVKDFLCTQKLQHASNEHMQHQSAKLVSAHCCCSWNRRKKVSSYEVTSGKKRKSLNSRSQGKPSKSHKTKNHEYSSKTENLTRNLPLSRQFDIQFKRLHYYTVQIDN